MADAPHRARPFNASPMPTSTLLHRRFEAVIIGGSAGSFPVVTKILESIPASFPLPLIMCLHRLKDKREGFKEALEIKSQLPVEEPNDKDRITPGMAFLAPANYHLLVEDRQTFSLATTEMVQYSRPSIDVLFESAADVYQDALLAIILSGANRDGAQGMRRVKNKGGYALVQDPKLSAMTTMPEAAIHSTSIDQVLSVDAIIAFLSQLKQPVRTR